MSLVADCITDAHAVNNSRELDKMRIIMLFWFTIYGYCLSREQGL